MAKKDPFMLDPEGAKKTEEETRLPGGGVICPKRNRSIGEKCNVCEVVSRIYNTSVDGDPIRRIASRKAAKVSYFMNVVFPENQDKSYIMVIGKRVGSRILEKLKAGEWLDIAHPKAGVGREMKLRKYQSEGFNAYELDVVLEKADWDIPDSVLNSLPNLDQDNLIKILEEDSEAIFRVSDNENMKIDETIRFRICPPWKEARDRGESKIMTPVYFHWGGVSEEEVRGEVEVNLNLPEYKEEAPKTEEVPPWEESPNLTTTSSPAHTKGREHEPCFGMENVYDAEDEECQKCPDFKPCGRVVLRK